MSGSHIMRLNTDQPNLLSAGAGSIGTAVGGDLSGTLPAPTVIGIGGIPIDSLPPTVTGDLIVFNATTGHWEIDLIATLLPFATPAIVLGTAAAAGAASTVIRSDATIVAFDATNPTSSAPGDIVATGSVAKSARRDHKHGRESWGLAADIGQEAFGTSAAAGATGKVADAGHIHQLPAVASAIDHTHAMDCLFSGDGANTVFELPVAPFDQWSVAAYVAGTLAEITLSNAMLTTATFGSAPASGTDNVRFDIVAKVF